MQYYAFILFIAESNFAPLDRAIKYATRPKLEFTTRSRWKFAQPPHAVCFHGAIFADSYDTYDTYIHSSYFEFLIYIEIGVKITDAKN